jgi:hypothetical protein
MVTESNWLRRDVVIKRKIGLDEDYWHRAATLLKIGSQRLAKMHRGLC